jgi:hypothetical protein
VCRRARTSAGKTGIPGNLKVVRLIDTNSV